MSGKKLLLDTNIIIRHFANDSFIVERIQEKNDIYIPSIVIGELYYGAEPSFRKKENIEKVEAFAMFFPVLVCDAKTANFYGHIKSDLKSRGTPIPEDDIWIAAIAMQHKLRVVTNDKHFRNIEELQVINW